MNLTTTEQHYYEIIVAAVNQQLAQFSPTLQASSQPYVTKLSERGTIKMLTLLPHWLNDILPVSPDVSQQLGLAQFYICWYYHAQDDLLDNAAETPLILGGHLALLKAVEIYDRLGVTRLPAWAEFNRLSQCSAESYALEMSTRFTEFSQITADHAAQFNQDFIINRLGPFRFVAVAQAYLAGRSDRLAAVITALRHFMTARQMGDDASDLLEDLQAGQLNSAAARLLPRFWAQGLAPTELNVERLAAYQLRDETFWAELRATSHELHQQAQLALAEYGDCQLWQRLIEPQFQQHAASWTAMQEQRANWRRLFGVEITTLTPSSGLMM